MYARLRFLKNYLPAVGKQAWLAAGTISSALGLIVGSILGLPIPRWAWIAALGTGLLIGQFELSFKTRQTTTEYDPLPYWAKMPTMVQGGGTWLSATLYGKPATKLPLPSTMYAALVDATESRLGVDRNGLYRRNFSGGAQLRMPKNEMDPLKFNVQAGIDAGESAAVQVIRTVLDDPLHIGWVMTYLDEMIRFCLSDVSDHWVKKRRRYLRVALTNWPTNGLVVDGLLNITKFSDQTHRGYGLPLDFPVGKRSDSWKIVKLYMSSVLADAGYVGYDEELANVEPDDCLKYQRTPGKEEIA